MKSGAVAVYAALTHPVCSDGWKRKVFYRNPFTKIIMGNTIPRDTEKRTGGRVHDVSLTGPMASKIVQVLQNTV